MTALSLSRRLRATAFSDAVAATGTAAMTIYGHTRLAASFHGLAEDCAHLKRAVQVWDVACQRQIRISGPDADALVALLIPRDLGRARSGGCWYAPMVGPEGGLLGDPVIRRTDHAWYLSLADSDLDLWAEGVAVGRGLDVEVAEADLQTMAVQGPRADALVARVLGDLSDLPFFQSCRSTSAAWNSGPRARASRGRVASSSTRRARSRSHSGTRCWRRAAIWMRGSAAPT